MFNFERNIGFSSSVRFVLGGMRFVLACGVFAATDSASALTWSPHQLVNTDAMSDGQYDHHPDLWLAGDTLVTAWSTHGIKFARSTNFGESWSNAKSIYVGKNTDHWTPEVAADEDGAVVVIWRNTGKAMFSRSDNWGDSWTAPAYIDAGATASSIAERGRED